MSPLSFLPGVVPEQPLTTSPVKRRTQSLSALPKDGDKNSPGKVVSLYRSHQNLKRSFNYNFVMHYYLVSFLSEGEGSHPATNECIYDFQ